jgi:hypothetical protein
MDFARLLAATDLSLLVRHASERAALVNYAHAWQRTYDA